MQNEKDHIKNLESREAIAKLKELVEDAHVCLFGTNVISGPPTQRPMSPIHTDEFGVLWFFSNINSDKNKEIGQNAKVQLSFINTSKNEFLCINGNAEVVVDQQKFKALWKPIVQAWFKGGDTDPELSLIKVTPLDSYYWDTKHGKMIAMIKTLASMVSGKVMDDGVEGKLTI
ncbi:MAG TPA: pyridoxamine 5'-phosphate oxidase family protein [Flavobacteriales bacterium]|nr:pyridoxamine 5'-phosphate oxidase family protein [Flavobacteriales bacterium]